MLHERAVYADKMRDVDDGERDDAYVEVLSYRRGCVKVARRDAQRGV